MTMFLCSLVASNVPSPALPHTFVDTLACHRACPASQADSCTPEVCYRCHADSQVVWCSPGTGHLSCQPCTHTPLGSCSSHHSAHRREGRRGRSRTYLSNHLHIWKLQQSPLYKPDINRERERVHLHSKLFLQVPCLQPGSLTHSL